MVYRRRVVRRKRATRKKYTPFGDVGSKIGGIFGAPVLGRHAGSMIGSLFGSGDYKIESNSIIQGASQEVPSFKGGNTVVRHREYIKDIVTSSVAGQFQNETFRINPGLAATFPWLCVIAQNYDEYKIHGMVFEFKTSSSDALNSTNTALGSVIMATEYNVVAPSFTTKQQMENYQYSNSAKPSLSQMHGIECAEGTAPLNELFIRQGDTAAGEDLRFYDFANFQIATVGFQAASVNIGELWVTYEIEFLKARIPRTIGGAQNCGHVVRYDSSVFSSNLLGATAVKSSGPLALDIFGATNNLLVGIS